MFSKQSFVIKMKTNYANRISYLLLCPVSSLICICIIAQSPPVDNEDEITLPHHLGSLSLARKSTKSACEGTNGPKLNNNVQNNLESFESICVEVDRTQVSPRNINLFTNGLSWSESFSNDRSVMLALFFLAFMV